MAGLSRASRFATMAINNFNVRSYSAAAAAQLHYDDDYDYDVDHHDRNRPMVDGEGSEPKRGVQWVIIGEPGSKKHVYAKALSKLLEVPHISMGSLVRQELNRRSNLYKQIEDAVNQGKLVPVDIIFSLLSKKLAEGYFKGESGFILDGIPRTIMQAEILDQIADIDLVLNLTCADEDLGKRELVNKLECQSQDSQIKSLSKVGVWKEKLRTYAEQSKPLEDYYRKQNKLLEFQVAGAPRETWHGLLSALQLQRMNSFRSALQLQHINSSFQKLSA